MSENATDSENASKPAQLSVFVFSTAMPHYGEGFWHARAFSTMRPPDRVQRLWPFAIRRFTAAQDAVARLRP